MGQASTPLLSYTPSPKLAMILIVNGHELHYILFNLCIYLNVSLTKTGILAHLVH